MTMRDIWHLIRDAGIDWDKDNAWRMGGALAYFTILSLAPLLILTIALSSFGYGEEAARGHLVAQIRGLIGVEGAQFVETLIVNAYESEADWFAAIIGIVMLVLGASAVIVELRGSLHSIWKLQEKPVGTITGFLRSRFLSLTMIMGMGFLLLVSLILSAVLAALGNYMSSSFVILGGIVDFLASFVGIALMFALLFKFLPAAVVQWKDALVGGAVTSLLFAFGKLAIGFYLGTSAIGSTFGAASSLVIIMLWTFYSSQIFLFGAEFTRLYAMRFGSGILPGRNAVRIILPEPKTLPEPNQRGSASLKAGHASGTREQRLPVRAGNRRGDH